MQINLLNIKKSNLIVAFALFYILSPFSLRSQGLYWDTLPNSDQRYEIKEIKCVNCQTCIKRMVDMNHVGAILDLTTDGGNTWKVIFTDTSFFQNNPFKLYIANNYMSFDFIAPGTIILSRDSGIVFKSYDMGNKWVEEIYDDSILRSYKMIDSDKGFKFEIKRNSKLLNIFYTYNSGNIWNKLDVPDKVKWDLFLIKGITQNGDMYFFTQNEENGLVLNWVLDSGKTWKHILYGSVLEFKDILFINDKIGYAVRHDKNDSGFIQQVILKTTNSGETWFNILDLDNKYGGLSKITSFDDNHLLVTGTYTNWIFRTSDAGITWNMDRITGYDSIKTPISIKNILLCDQKNGYISTSKNIYKLSNIEVPTSVVENFTLRDKKFALNSFINYINESIILHIDSMSNKQVYLIHIYDLTGRLLHEINQSNFQIYGNDLIISNIELMKGQYSIIVQTSNETNYFRVLIRD